ncbi:MAG: cysteine desulfurase [Rhodospirillaceae bacterium]|nr:cysteine desulfurase [Rhodospirillaceae bacterium]
MNAISAVSENTAFNVARWRADFPLLAEQVYDKPLVFLDSAASAQKPQSVIDAVSYCYEHEYANIHRGVYWLSQKSTEAYEQARVKVQGFINAASEREIVFTKGTTEAINLVASSYGGSELQAGDEIILSHLEHHANIVPWQLLRQRIGIEIKVAPIDEQGNFLLEEFEKLLSPRTRLVAITHGSNALGTIPPVDDIIRLSHARGALVLLDGAQAVVHGPVDMQALDVDFYAFSGHKLYGPSGIGVLYGKADLLKAMPPYQGGGDMIKSVTFEKTEFADIPGRFEAGTPHIAGAYGLSAAIDYVSAIGMSNIARHEQELLSYATARLQEINSLRLIGTADNKAGIVSFELDGVHAHDIGTILDREGIAVRVGHHCAQPLMERFNITGTVRASFGLYNNKADIDALVAALGAVREIFD